MPNPETGRLAIEYVMQLERAVGRLPEDVSRRGAPYDISSPPRKIEVKAVGGSARGAQIPLEERQVIEARRDPDNYYVYVVDNVVANGSAEPTVRVLHGELLRTMIDRTTPHITYWPTLRLADYDRLAHEID